METDDFQILVLRHDPVDFPRYRSYVHKHNILRPREGAMDPTGPVYWLRYFPDTDPDIVEDARCLAECEGNLRKWMEERDVNFDCEREGDYYECQ
ncbi:hypothetical protein SCHPADRAFT_901686 [Schizopora paradoxa]|uniref:Uncharacterized protein n=1 Tax=Schizopora paradoxa TaxID=27342 RepID=A0A0H2SGS1_9AGAM|nr:hypothetical protein SCHPADRAFT_901686 [Schizopora paradoxa]